MSNEFRSLSKRERLLLTKLESVQSFLDEFDGENSVQEVKVRLDDLQAVHVEFYTVREKLELLLEEADEEKTKELTEAAKKEARRQREADNLRHVLYFEDRICKMKAQLTQLLPVQTCGNVQSLVRTSPATSTNKVKLPKIRLPSFSGKLREWVSFRSLIHTNINLDDMDRFTYLRASLSGEALQEVSSIAITADNYEVAWNLFRTRYENTKLIVKAHLDSLFAVEPLKRESYEGLNHLIT